MNDYFSLDAILATEPRIYTTFQTAGHNLAHLDPHGAAAYHAAHPLPPSPRADAQHDRTRDLPRAHRVALPFWLASSLAARGVATVALPRCYAAAARHALRADARCVRLAERCSAYYDLGVLLGGLLREAGLGGALVRAFAARCWGIVDGGSVRGLEARERRLFWAARGVEGGVRRWKEGRLERIGGGVLGKRGREQGDVGSPVTPAAQRVR